VLLLAIVMAGSLCLRRYVAMVMAASSCVAYFIGYGIG
jgi:hypothetical protein